jgi:hypothetical protein
MNRLLPLGESQRGVKPLSKTPSPSPNKLISDSHKIVPFGEGD